MLRNRGKGQGARGKGTIYTSEAGLRSATWRLGKLVRVILPLTFALLTLAACGYQLVREQGLFGGDITSLDIPVFKNRTLEPHVPEPFTLAFTRELVSSGVFQVNRGDADHTLQGTVSSVRVIPSAMDKNGIVVEKVVIITIDLVLSKKDGTFVRRWPLSDSEPYRVDNINVEDFNRRQAEGRLADRTARRFSALVLANY